MALLALAGHTVATAKPPSVFRCTVNGQTVYQQSACNEGRALLVDAAPTAAARQAQEQDTTRLQHAASALEAARLRREGAGITSTSARPPSGGKGTAKGRGPQAPMGTAPAPAPPSPPKRLDPQP